MLSGEALSSYTETSGCVCGTSSEDGVGLRQEGNRNSVGQPWNHPGARREEQGRERARPHGKLTQEEGGYSASKVEWGRTGSCLPVNSSIRFSAAANSRPQTMPSISSQGFGMDGFYL